jgi:hypothetical protein
MVNTEKVIQNVKEEIKQLKFYNKIRTDFMNSADNRTEEERKEWWEMMEKEYKEGKNFIGTYWFNDYNRKATMEFFELYDELEKANLWLQNEIKEEAETHLGAMQYARKLADGEIEKLREEQLDLVRKLAEEKVKNMKLVEQSEEDRKALKSLNEKLVEEKQNSLKIRLDKPLPKLPSKFKIFKKKAKTRLQSLAEKVNTEKQKLEQKLIAKIEVRFGAC